jgi:hypothetical protein
MRILQSDAPKTQVSVTQTKLQNLAEGDAPRPCLLIDLPDAGVDDGAGQCDAAEVGQGVFDAPMDVKRLSWPVPVGLGRG